MKVNVLLFVLIVGRLVCLAEDPSNPIVKPIWGRSLIGEALPDGNDKRLDCDDISQGPEHLVVSCILTRQDAGTTQLVIQGHFNKRGEFTPNVSLEVSDREDRNWKTVESSFADVVELTLTGAPRINRLYTTIQVDALQAYIGKFKFCRIVLQTGEYNVFPLIWLTEKGE